MNDTILAEIDLRSHISSHSLYARLVWQVIIDEDGEWTDLLDMPVEALIAARRFLADDY